MRNFFAFICTISLGVLVGCYSLQSQSEYAIDRVYTTKNIVPLAVIGSGPGGMMAAIYGARGGTDTYVIEGNKPGGLLMDTTEVENWPGEVSIQGKEIIDKLRVQAVHQGVKFLDETIEKVDLKQWPFKLHTESGQEINALSVVIATGASPRLLGIPGEEKYWGGGVTSCAVCDAPFFKNEEVVVVGGGDSAVEEAIQLAPFASKITVLVRKGQMRAAASMQERLKDYDKISVKYNVEVQEIVGDDSLVKKVRLYNNVTKNVDDFETSGVFLAIGHNPNSTLFKNQINIDSTGYIVTDDQTQQTSIPGVFAAGDIEDNRYRQAGSSAGRGIQAGLDAVNFLNEIGYTTKVAHAIQGNLFGSSTVSGDQLLDVQVKSLTTSAELDGLLEDKSGVVVLDFWAETCPSCKQMLPVVDSVAQQFKDKVRFAKIDIDEAPEIREKLLINKVPCLLVYKEGDLVARYNNPMSKKELTNFVDKFVA